MDIKEAVNLLSKKAEYKAATSSVCHAIWLQRVLCDLKQSKMGRRGCFAKVIYYRDDKETNTSRTDQAHRNSSSFHWKSCG